MLRRRPSQVSRAQWTWSTDIGGIATEGKAYPRYLFVRYNETGNRSEAYCIDTEHLGHLPIAIRRALSENNLREERDQSEKKLRHSEARYRALVGNLTYGICRCGEKGKFLDVNQALVTMLGYSSRKELLTATHARDVLCDSYKRQQLLGQPGNENGGGSIEVDWRRKDGTPLKVRLSGRGVATDGGKDSYEIIVEDITQQRKLEDSLRQQATKDPLTGHSAASPMC